MTIHLPHLMKSWVTYGKPSVAIRTIAANRVVPIKQNERNLFAVQSNLLPVDYFVASTVLAVRFCWSSHS